MYINTIILMIFLLALGGGIIVLQIFLSKQESKWAGLILPIITFGFSLIFVLSVANRGELSTVIIAILTAFMFCNISTAVLLVIYVACRGKRKKRRALDKMSVQNL